MALPFMGEEMRCILCPKVERSDPRVETDWRCVSADDVPFYVCPAHFPPDGAGAAAFQSAYNSVLDRIIQIRKETRNHV